MTGRLKRIVRRPIVGRPVVGRRSGISLVELSLATLMTGLLMVAALQTAGQTLVAQRKTADRSLGHFLANGLLNEIRGLPYCEPGTSEPAICVDSGEAAATRT